MAKEHVDENRNSVVEQCGGNENNTDPKKDTSVKKAVIGTGQPMSINSENLIVDHVSKENDAEVGPGEKSGLNVKDTVEIATVDNKSLVGIQDNAKVDKEVEVIPNTKVAGKVTGKKKVIRRIIRRKIVKGKGKAKTVKKKNVENECAEASMNIDQQEITPVLDEGLDVSNCLETEVKTADIEKQEADVKPSDQKIKNETEDSISQPDTSQSLIDDESSKNDLKKSSQNKKESEKTKEELELKGKNDKPESKHVKDKHQHDSVKSKQDSKHDPKVKSAKETSDKVIVENVSHPGFFLQIKRGKETKVNLLFIYFIFFQILIVRLFTFFRFDQYHSLLMGF